MAVVVTNMVVSAGHGCHSVKRLSKLSVRWIRLGIEPRLIQPGKPQQNGRLERMHRDLKREACAQPAEDCRRQQVQFDRFVDRFNYIRPTRLLVRHHLREATSVPRANTPSDYLRSSIPPTAWSEAFGAAVRSSGEANGSFGARHWPASTSLSRPSTTAARSFASASSSSGTTLTATTDSTLIEPDLPHPHSGPTNSPARNRASRSSRLIPRP